MEKKEFPKEPLPINEGLPETGGESGFAAGVKEKVSVFSNWLFGVVKFFLGLCLLPFVYSCAVSFLKEFSLVQKPQTTYFWAGVITLVAIHLLVWEPAKIYVFGHKILEIVFNFFKPLVKVAPYLLPIYAIVLFVSYLIFSNFIKSSALFAYMVFLFGFSVALHLVFSAKALRAKKGDFLKGNYIFGFSSVCITNLAILAFFFSIIFEKFSFINFTNQAYQSAQGIFHAVFRQLFL